MLNQKRFSSKQALFEIIGSTFRCSRVVIGEDPSSEGLCYQVIVELKATYAFEQGRFPFEKRVQSKKKGSMWFQYVLLSQQ